MNCLGNVGAKYDETAYPFAVATFTGSACEASSTPLKSRLQLYNSVGKGCEALPGPMSPTHADYTNKGYDITVIPHIILPTVSDNAAITRTPVHPQNQPQCMCVCIYAMLSMVIPLHTMHVGWRALCIHSYHSYDSSIHPSINYSINSFHSSMCPFVRFVV